MEIKKYFTTEKSRRYIQKGITAVAVFSPLLAMYGVNISTITFLDVAIAMAALLILLSDQLEAVLTMTGYRRWLAVAAILVALNYLLHFLWYPGSLKLSIFLRCARYILYLGFVCILLNPLFFDAQFGLKLFRFLAIFAAGYLLLQYVLLYVLHYSLPGYITWLPLMRPELASFTEKLGATFYARPRSIFAEPSQFGIVASGYLLLSVFYQKREKDWFEKIVLLLAMALSASSTALLGIGIAALAYAARLYKRYEKQKKKFVYAVLIAVCAVLLLCVCSSFVRDRIMYLLQRLPNSFSNRLGGFLEYRERAKSFSVLQILFGIGMDLRDMTVWYSGLIKILLYFGIFGMGFFMLFVAKLIMTAQPMQRVYALVFLLFSIFSEILVSNWLILFLPFVLRDLEKYPADAMCEKWIQKLPLYSEIFGENGYVVHLWNKIKHFVFKIFQQARKG